MNVRSHTDPPKSIVPEHPDLAVLFGAVGGAAGLSGALGETLAQRRIIDCLEQLAEVIKQQGGTVVKTIGDEILCHFPTIDQAATAACQMHEHIAAEPVVPTDNGMIALNARVGFHFGPVLLENSDIFGDAVNVAARLVALAKPQQIILTREVADQLPPILKANSRFIDRATVKGKKDLVDIYELVWQQNDVTRMSTNAVIKAASQPAELRLDYGGAQYRVNGEHNRVVLGRSKGADITVHESLSSRLHVTIEYRRGKFFIIDQSTNGTYLEHNGLASFLRREEQLLTGEGKFSLGRPFTEQSVDPIRYRIVN